MRDFGSRYNLDYVDGDIVPGRRDPQRRLDKLDIDFIGKKVIDLGCNSGGILFAIQDQIAFGWGYEYNAEAVELAERVRKDKGIENLMFIQCNLEKDIDFPACDIVFMLSIANWVKNWKNIVLQMRRKSSVLVFEAHGKKTDEQLKWLKTQFGSVLIVFVDSEDGNLRKLAVCT